MMESQPGAGVSTSRLLLHLRHVHKVREKGGQRFTLHVPAFSVEQGEFVALVGASGCGKSTLLDMLALVLRPDAAEQFTLRVPRSGLTYEIMSLVDDNLAHLRRSAIGYVLQTGGLLPFLTVKDNILLPCRMNGMTGMETWLMDLTERLAITEQLSKKPRFLSSGQRQRVAIARALAHNPPLILADEPTAAVDQPTAREICDIFKELTQQLAVTLCMVTHDARLVADAANRTFFFEVYKESTTCTQAICMEAL